MKTGKFGHVAVIGRPNVGKSTLLNRIVGQTICAVSTTPQTTRRHWTAIRTDEDSQIAFLDTPGVHKPSDKLGRSMRNETARQIEAADVVLLVVDALRFHGEEDVMAMEEASASGKPCFLAINKIDGTDKAQAAKTEHYFRSRLGKKPVAAVWISALTGDGVEELVQKIKLTLPQGLFQYDPEAVTEAQEREIAAELIQETVFEELREEIPHGVAVRIDSWVDEERKAVIDATLVASRDNHVGMLVGHGGTMVKAIRLRSLVKIKHLLQRPAKLSLSVKCLDGWRDNPSMMKELGFKPG